MDVSVLIPVYNAEKYLRQAVESALAQPETKQIVLVEDGSTDNSLLLCYQLSEQHPIIEVFQHPSGANRGEASSRNLLLDKASCEIISFLDADDFYLPNRFKVALEILDSQPEVDAVYEAFAIFYDDVELQQKYTANTSNLIRYLSQPIDAEDLFYSLMTTTAGTPGMPAMTIRRQAFTKLPRFNEALRTSPDAPLVYQMTALCHCVAGEISRPIFMYRHHQSNLYAGTYESNPRKATSIWLAWTQYFWDWSKNNLDGNQCDYVRVFLMRHAGRTSISQLPSNKFLSKILFKLQLVLTLLNLQRFYPSISSRWTYWKTFANLLLGRSSQ